MSKMQKPIIDQRLRHIAFIMDGNGRWAKSAACLVRLDIEKV